MALTFGSLLTRLALCGPGILRSQRVKLGAFTVPGGDARGCGRLLAARLSASKIGPIHRNGGDWWLERRSTNSLGVRAGTDRGGSAPSMICYICMVLFASRTHAFMPSSRALLAPFGQIALPEGRVEAERLSILVRGAEPDQRLRHAHESAIPSFAFAFLAFSIAFAFLARPCLT